MDLELRAEPVQGDPAAAVLTLTGVLNAITSPTFEDQSNAFRSRGVKRVVLDMSGVKYVNSTGLGALVKVADAYRSAGGGIAIVRLPSKVAIIIELSGLMELFNVQPDLPTALTVLGSVGGPPPDRSGNRSPADSTGFFWRSAAARLAAEDPELALRKCRGSLEKLLRHLHVLHLGDASHLDMNAVVGALKAQRLLPSKIFSLTFSVWDLSNPQSPPLTQDDDALSHEAFIAVAAMTVLQRWFRATYNA